MQLILKLIAMNRLDQKFQEKGFETFTEEGLQGGLLWCCEILKYKPHIQAPSSDTDRDP